MRFCADQAPLRMEIFGKSLDLLKSNHCIKCNISSSRTCLSIAKHSSIPKISAQNTSSIKNVFEDSKSSLIETLSVQTLFYEPTEIVIFYRNEFI